ncbi:MAG: hypothetical protein J5818_01420, partial [Eggerthellaceae bacterium]|nr:hypothetical protein [Eggerthellaceae bacterium]
MEKLTYFPLRAQEDALKRAFILSGFSLVDDDLAPEVETPDWAIEIFKHREGKSRKPILLEGGAYALRSELLAAQLVNIQGAVPCKAFSCGSVYDGNDTTHPRRRIIQGVWIARDLSVRECTRFCDQLVENVLGIGAKAEVAMAGNASIMVNACIDDRSFAFAVAGKASPMARALLGIVEADVEAWFFEVCVDDVAMAVYGIDSRDELYSPLYSKLAAYEGDTPTFGNLYVSRASNVLRKLGFNEFSGLAVYEDDCYKKMNMIQEAW